VKGPFIVDTLGFRSEFREEVDKGECVSGVGVGGETEGVAKRVAEIGEVRV